MKPTITKPTDNSATRPIFPKGRACTHAGRGIFRFCVFCGYKFPDIGKQLNGECISIRHKGYVEVYFEKISHCGFVKIFTDDERAWMYPVVKASSECQVLYDGLAEFMDTATDPDSPIDLFVDDPYIVSSYDDGRRFAKQADKDAWVRLKNRMRNRPYILLHLIGPRMLREKLDFLKYQFGQTLERMK